MNDRHKGQSRHLRFLFSALLPGCLAIMPSGCPSPPGFSDGVMSPPMWYEAFDTSTAGALSSVWGSSADDVFIVGGIQGAGEIYHFNGTGWKAMDVPEVPLLVWVFGFDPDDVFSVGEDGAVIHYDGSTWTALSSGTDEDLWGVWGKAPDDLWIVGGDVGVGEPVILHFDGNVFTPVAVPENDRSATSLFKVWGIGSTVFAVGQNGLIIELRDGEWSQVPAGSAADDDFVSLWGTSEDNIVAVGGRTSARIARYDGVSWTSELLDRTPGLNGVFMVDATEAIVVGTNGYAGRYDVASGSLTKEESGTSLCLHAVWAAGRDAFYAVGGQFRDPYQGVAVVRRSGSADDTRAVSP